MMCFTLLTALLLCSLSSVSVSSSGYQTVEVQPGGEVTLLCSNVSKHDSVTFWLRLDNRTKLRCISVMFRSNVKAEFCEGFQDGTFEMSSNISTLILRIKQVASSYSGLYFCGFYVNGCQSFSVIHLKVKGSDELNDDLDSEFKKVSDGIMKLMSVILAAVTVFLIHVIIGLTVKVRRLQTAANEEQNPQQSQTLDSSDMKDATDLSLYSAAIRSRRPASEREVETRVVYTASRETQGESGTAPQNGTCCVVS